ncbi:MAG: exosortase system-associated protein, TIGR04073 family [Candidatus Aadella gelida]|nr:exosortase system-associated protein, TIGR04073 family [Candidatus Aadella gelida]
MKKCVLILILIVLTLSVPVNSYAKNNPATKLGRGAANLITGGVEIPKGFMDFHAKDGWVSGATAGVCVGIFKAIGRSFVGVYEIVTFLIPIPEYYEPILTDPEYMLSTN